MKTEQIPSSCRTLKEKDKEKLIKMYEKNNVELLQCKESDNQDTISYDEKNNCLDFDVECESGYSGGIISTDSMSNETIMRIIRILLDILQKRMQNKKDEVKEND